MKQEQIITIRNRVEEFLDEHEVDLANAGKLKALDYISDAANSLSFLNMPNANELQTYKEAADNIDKALLLMKDFRDDVWKEISAENLQAYQIYSELNDVRLGYLSLVDHLKLKKEHGMEFNLRNGGRDWEYTLIENTLN